MGLLVRRWAHVVLESSCVESGTNWSRVADDSVEVEKGSDYGPEACMRTPSFVKNGRQGWPWEVWRLDGEALDRS